MSCNCRSCLCSYISPLLFLMASLALFIVGLAFLQNSVSHLSKTANASIPLMSTTKSSSSSHLKPIASRLTHFFPKFYGNETNVTSAALTKGPKVKPNLLRSISRPSPTTWSSPATDNEEIQQLMREYYSKNKGLSKSAMKIIGRHSLVRLKSSTRSRPVIITKVSQIRKKKDWCRTEVLKQRIMERGCSPKVIINNYCYGQCNSFYIPSLMDENEVDSNDDHKNRTENAAFKSCAFCKPQKVRHASVRLNCPYSSPTVRRKKVLIIQKCRCLTEILQ